MCAGTGGIAGLQRIGGPCQSHCLASREGGGGVDIDVSQAQAVENQFPQCVESLAGVSGDVGIRSRISRQAVALIDHTQHILPAKPVGNLRRFLCRK